jgi:hypothetical protein
MAKSRTPESRKNPTERCSPEAGARQASSDSINVSAAEIARLQSLNQLDYERQRVAAAKKLSVRVSALDTVVSQRRRNGRDERRALAAANVEPWPGPIDGAKLLDDAAAFVGRFVAHPSKDAHIAHVLWIGHTHFMNCWESTPRLAVMSEEPTSGKSRLLEVTEHLVPNPVMTIGPSESYLFRKIGDEDFRPTILFDEIDTVFGPKAPPAEGIRRLLNAGHRRGAKVGRTVVGNGKPYTEDIPAYAAVAVAGLHLDELPDTLRKRAVIIKMRTRLKTEKVESWRIRLHEPQARELGRKLMVWAASVENKIQWPELPQGIEDRDADVWEPLIAVADAAGGDWPDKSRIAAVGLVTLTQHQAMSRGVRLLRDLRTVWGDARAWHTADLLAKLHCLPESEWKAVEGRRNALDDRGLAKLLSGYDISSDDIKIGGKTLKGYWRTDLRSGKASLSDVWQRYVAPEKGQPPQPGQPAHSEPEVAKVAEVAPPGPQEAAYQRGDEIDLPDFLRRVA